MIQNKEEESGRREDEAERDQGTKIKDGIPNRTQALSYPNSPQFSLPHIQEEITVTVATSSRSLLGVTFHT